VRCAAVDLLNLEADALSRFIPGEEHALATPKPRLAFEALTASDIVGELGGA